MVKPKRFKRFLSLVCITSMLLSLSITGGLAFASDEEADAQNGAAVTQEENTEEEATDTDNEKADNAVVNTEEDIEESKLPANKVFVKKTRAGAISSDLADFLTSVSINAAVDEQGNYIVNPNSSYEMTLKFSENERIQFEDEETLTYIFPDGVVVSDIEATTFSIRVEDGNGIATVSGNTYEVVDGKLRVRFNQNDSNFTRLKAAANAKFNITIKSSYNKSDGIIEFAPGIIKEFVYDNSADINITKKVTYDKVSDTATYVLQISSAGLNENVILKTI